MQISRRIDDLRAHVAAWRRAGDTVALVPTMGALHAGHLSLVELALASADRAVATIFVNPAQFGEGEDFETYPRDEARDAAALANAGCGLLFAPPADEMYPPGFATDVRVRGLTDCLCGAARPGHFDGVAVVVAKLLNQAMADVAVFGEKDWQQLAVIRRLARDLDIPTRILGAPILREPDGLALSSRNRYLDAGQRQVAPALHGGLRRAAAAIGAGGVVEVVLAAERDILLSAGFDAVDYLECRTADTLEPVTRPDPDRPARLFGAAHLGGARLIDNVPLMDTSS